MDGNRMEKPLGKEDNAGNKHHDIYRRSRGSSRWLDASVRQGVAKGKFQDWVRG